jgi:hypothetical protein
MLRNKLKVKATGLKPVALELEKIVGPKAPKQFIRQPAELSRLLAHRFQLHC